MAKARKLKVYRTPIGFHDAYVAAPSQKAALEAWGSDADLFARGIAERVEDEALGKEALDHPGTVIRRLRGTKDEQLAALPADAPRSPDRKARPVKAAEHKTTEKPAPQKTAPKAEPRPKKPKPKPSRAALDRAERELDRLLATQKDEDAALRAREQAIEKARQDLDRRHARERDAADSKLRKAREAHVAALDRWTNSRN